MKKQTKEDLINYRMSKAKTTFAEVDDLVNLKYYNTAINRLYYASFYAVLSLLLFYNLSAKTHAGVRRMFGLHFVSKKIISKNSGKIFSELFEMRIKGDYNDFFDIDKNDVLELIEPTNILIKEIISVINKDK